MIAFVDTQRDFGLQRGAHFAVGAKYFNVLVDDIAQLADTRPLGQQCGVGCAELGVGLHEDRFGRSEHGPGLFGGEAQERRHPAQHGVGDLVQGSLRAAPGQRLGRAGVKPVFQNVEVKRAQVFAAVNLQLGDHRVEFIHLVVRQDVGLQLGCAA